MTQARFISLLVTLLAAGTGAGYALGLGAAETINHLLALTLLLGFWHALTLGDPPRDDAAVGAALAAALRDLLEGSADAATRARRRAALVLAAGVAVYAVLLVRHGGALPARWPFDQVWHQAMIDYDALWRTPFASIPGNLLYQFDMRLPVSTPAMPLLGLSTLVPPVWRVAAVDTLLFVAMLGLFLVIGATWGLRAPARAVLAAAVALISVVPHGLEWLLPLVPPEFFTTQRVLATWWGEGPWLALSTVVAFYWIGQARAAWRNALAAGLFALGITACVIGYPAGGVYFVPLIAVYAAAFLFTSRGRAEWGWKVAVATAVGLAALALRVPQFFSALYGYTFGSYFFDLFAAPTGALIHDIFAIVVRGFDWRRAVFFCGGLAMAVYLLRHGPRPLARFALGTLAFEAVIVTGGVVNAVLFRAPMLFSYAETAHGALWASYFILLVMAAAMAADRNLAARAEAATGLARRMLTHRRAALAVSAVAIFGAAMLALPAPSRLAYPPGRPPMVDILARELALAPGAAFRGRALTLFTHDGDADIYSLALRARRSLGNDFLEELLPFGIPTLNQGQHWTSPVTFALLHRFFGTSGDAVDKNFFWLNRFDARMARLTGVRLVVSDGAVEGATVLAEAPVGARMLRLYRLDDVNLGQYSPTRAQRVATAAAAIAVLEGAAFDPQRDVVVEGDGPADLTPARTVAVTAETGARLRVRASSPGRSLIVLPFEFSHCLVVSGTPGVALLPVNLQQVGLLFEKEAEVTLEYRYGVGHDACRRADLTRARALDLRAIVPTRAP